MINRRNIRVKVMQVLYADEYTADFSHDNVADSVTDNDAKSMEKRIQACEEMFLKKVESSASLFYTLLTYWCKIAHYAVVEAERKTSRFTAKSDKDINVKIAENTAVTALWQNEDFQKKREHYKVNAFINEKWIKKLFRKLEETTFYEDYVANAEPSAESDREIMYFIWTDVMMGNEDFVNDLDDEWQNWESDRRLLEILMENYSKDPHYLKFRTFISKEKRQYAEDLMRTVIEKDEFLLSQIQGKLQHWDARRVAKIDLILLKMGLSEFLYFPTIPVKATINEYIDIAKNYSTDQSGQFVNGILDNLLKDLKSKNKIKKTAGPY